MKPDLQPILDNDSVILYPLQPGDFEELYAVASDPKIWEQHPNKNRWQQAEFGKFFEGALQSGGAFKIVDKTTGKAIGSTRFYDYNEAQNRILIGYTFYAVACWGKGFNRAVKALQLNFIFQFAAAVIFHVGAGNVRSQIAMGRLGATKIGEEEVAYFGEPSGLNFVYELTKSQWLLRKD